MSEAQARREFALEVAMRLRRAGFQALWAGGCVRDLILGLTPADYDVATDATPEQVMLTLPFRAITVGISFGVVRVRHPSGQRDRGRGGHVSQRPGLCGRPAAHIGRLQLARARRRPPRLHDQRHVHGSGNGPGDRSRGRPRQTCEPRFSAPSAIPRSGFAKTSCGCSARSGSRPGSASKSSPNTSRRHRAMAARGRSRLTRADRARSCGGCSCTRPARSP